MDPEPHTQASPLRVDPYGHRRGEPRVFAFVWTLFLMGATIVAFLSVGPGGVASRGVYRAAANGLILTVVVGVIVLWPMVRLSQARPPGGAARSLRQDLIVLLVPVQAVLWPQVLLGGWSAGRLAAIDAVIVGWASLVGAVTAVGLERSVSGAGRTGWMVCIVLIASVGMVPAALGAPRVVALASSPVVASLDLLRNEWTTPVALPTPAHWLAAGVPLALSVPLWALAGVRRGGGSGGAGLE